MSTKLSAIAALTNGEYELPCIIIDKEADAAYVLLTHEHATWTRQCDGYNLDIDDHDNIVGVELLTMNVIEHIAPDHDHLFL